MINSHLIQLIGCPYSYIIQDKEANTFMCVSNAVQRGALSHSISRNYNPVNCSTRS